MRSLPAALTLASLALLATPAAAGVAGSWRVNGQVADKPFAEGQCPIKYDSPDNDDETVPLKRVRRLD